MHTRLTTPTRATGTVKWFNDAKGLGLIARDDGRPDCPVQRAAVRGGDIASLSAGDRVEFDVVDGEQGQSAANVTRLIRYIH